MTVGAPLTSMYAPRTFPNRALNGVCSSSQHLFSEQHRPCRCFFLSHFFLAPNAILLHVLYVIRVAAIALMWTVSVVDVAIGNIPGLWHSRVAPKHPRFSNTPCFVTVSSAWFSPIRFEGISCGCTERRCPCAKKRVPICSSARITRTQVVDICCY